MINAQNTLVVVALVTTMLCGCYSHAAVIRVRAPEGTYAEIRDIVNRVCREHDVPLESIEHMEGEVVQIEYKPWKMLCKCSSRSGRGHGGHLRLVAYAGLTRPAVYIGIDDYDRFRESEWAKAIRLALEEQLKGLLGENPEVELKTYFTIPP